MLDWNTIHLLAAKGAPLAVTGRIRSPQPRPPRTRRSFVAPALWLLAAILAAGLLALTVNRKEAAIRALPPDARAQILEHGLTELSTICHEPSASEGPLHARCVEQAKLVLLLPECGPECRTVATLALPHARR
jgi:hypothetical protein